jgi:hypothetical protein
MYCPGHHEQLLPFSAVLEHLEESRHVHVLDLSTRASQLLSCSKQGVISPVLAVLSRLETEEGINFAVRVACREKCWRSYTERKQLWRDRMLRCHDAILEPS